MSKLICASCGAWVEDTDEFCGSCGSKNRNRKVVANGIPKTMVELKKWHDEMLCINDQRYCVFGEISNKPSIIGIVRKNNKFLVYETNYGGASTFLYEGDDEEHAVEVVYLYLLKRTSQTKELINEFMLPSASTSKTGYKK